MTLSDPLRFVVIGLVAGFVSAPIAYVFYKLVRILNKADKYLEARAKEAEPKK